MAIVSALLPTELHKLKFVKVYRKFLAGQEYRKNSNHAVVLRVRPRDTVMTVQRKEWVRPDVLQAWTAYPILVFRV